jgi:5-methylcytosine-specific restriction endonuclease McrA
LSAFYTDNSRADKKTSRCKICEKDRLARLRLRAKKTFLEYKGGAKCVQCGYDKYIGALDFHHVNPAKKKFAFKTVMVLTAAVKAELDKCVVLCANCHREVEQRFYE